MSCGVELSGSPTVVIVVVRDVVSSRCETAVSPPLLIPGAPVLTIREVGTYRAAAELWATKYGGQVSLFVCRSGNVGSKRPD